LLISGFASKLLRFTYRGLSFISNRQRRKEGTFCASELTGIELKTPALEEQGMTTFANLQVTPGVSFLIEKM
jgi:hypothetical protein